MCGLRCHSSHKQAVHAAPSCTVLLPVVTSVKQQVCEGIRLTKSYRAALEQCVQACSTKGLPGHRPLCCRSAGGELDGLPTQAWLHHCERGRPAAVLERRPPEVQLPPRAHAPGGRAPGAPLHGHYSPSMVVILLKSEKAHSVRPCWLPSERMATPSCSIEG